MRVQSKADIVGIEYEKERVQTFSRQQYWRFSSLHLLSFRLLTSLPILSFLMVVKSVPDNERDEHERQTDCEVNP